MKKKYTKLSFEERFVIEKLFSVGTYIRAIALVLGRSPNTVSREIKKNQVRGKYDAVKAEKKSGVRRWGAKRQFLKVAMNEFLSKFIEDKLREKWSPKQISGFLKEKVGIICSAKAIYKFAESRALEHLLFWGWNHKKGGRKRGHWKTTKDGRIYVDSRPEVRGSGHFEMDFIVSKQRVMGSEGNGVRPVILSKSMV